MENSEWKEERKNSWKEEQVGSILDGRKEEKKHSWEEVRKEAFKGIRR